MQADTTCSRWICKTREQQIGTAHGRKPKIRLFCIPPAGTGTWVYQAWWRSLPDYVEVLPVELPGSGLRMREPRKTCMQTLVHSMILALTPLLLQDVPYTIFGHSMGAWVAFELAQEANRLGMPLPTMLIVSGNSAPHLARPQHDVDPTVMHTLCYKDFWLAFERRYGLNPDLADDRVRQMVWPSLHADFTLVETYKADTLDVLPCPLTAIGALQDKRYTPEQVDAWRCHTCKAYAQHWVVGHHDYIVKSAIASGLITVIQNALSDDKCC